MTADDARAGSGLRSRELAVAAALALAVVVATAAFPMIVDARAAYEIPVEQQAGAGDLAEPTGDAWESVETVSVPLSSSGAGAGRHRNHGRVRQRRGRANGRAALPPNVVERRDGEHVDRFAARIRRCRRGPASGLVRGTAPPIAMGSTDNRVNVWYWNGADGTESLATAGGAGSTTQIRGSRRWRRTRHTPATDGPSCSAGRSRQTART